LVLPRHKQNEATKKRTGLYTSQEGKQGFNGDKQSKR
jgi:hypothetical protein